jgi:hypothetical protein
MLACGSVASMDEPRTSSWRAEGDAKTTRLSSLSDAFGDGDNYSGPMPNFQLVFADKRTNSTGLQLADLTARPIGRHVLDPAQPNRAWDILEPKLRRSSTGVLKGWGLKTFP